MTSQRQCINLAYQTPLLHAYRSSFPIPTLPIHSVPNLCTYPKSPHIRSAQWPHHSGPYQLDPTTLPAPGWHNRPCRFSLLESRSSSSGSRTNMKCCVMILEMYPLGQGFKCLASMCPYFVGQLVATAQHQTSETNEMQLT